MNSLWNLFKPVLNIGVPQLIIIVAIIILANRLPFLIRWLKSLLQKRYLKAISRRPLRSKLKLEPTDKMGFSNDKDWLKAKGPIVLESIEIRNFKAFEKLEMSFSSESEFSGYWACIAGINGSGKSSILQAICLSLLGNELATDLGRGRLSRMSRRKAKEVYYAELFAVVRQAGHRRQLFLPFSEMGIDEDRLREHPEFKSMQITWQKLRRQILVSFGATRNLSAEKAYRSPLLSEVQQQLSLFDPLTEITSAEALLSGGEDSQAALNTLRKLLPAVLVPEEVETKFSGQDVPILFKQGEAQLEAIDLPDGFRATVAWLAALCAAWHETAKKQDIKVSSDPTQITGIVLIDEIGLHLHPALERAIVPRLRKALPRVQFIITTHSPMVLASFDRTELKVLDPENETGLRQPLDRQIFGFSMDDVYEYLMGTSPASTVIEELLKEGTSEKLATYLYQSKDVNEKQAQEILAEREKLIRRLDEKRNKAQ